MAAGVKRLLASHGIRPASYAWLLEKCGFRCGGGSHLVLFGQLGLLFESASFRREKREEKNEYKDFLSSDTRVLAVSIELRSNRWSFVLSLRDFFRHSLCASSCRLDSQNHLVALLVYISLGFCILNSPLHCIAASLGKEKLSISHVEMMHAWRADPLSVEAFGWASRATITSVSLRLRRIETDFARRPIF